MKKQRLGIMQGRLTPPIGARFQAFPAGHWREEFTSAREAGLDSIEWIYDAGEDDVNPLATAEGIAEMKALSKETGVEVISVCADCFMPEPLLKGTREEKAARAKKLCWLVEQCRFAGIQRVVLPFVDASKIASPEERAELLELLGKVLPVAAQQGLEIHLETDMAPEPFARLIEDANHPALKINYDSGNSASLGYKTEDEFAAYAKYIGSVHIKDRVFQGSTVPLGTGQADFPTLFRLLKKIGYSGDYILQTARDKSQSEVDLARQNIRFVQAQLAAA